VSEIERNRSLKVFKLFTERIGEPRQAARRPQRAILFLNMSGGNAIRECAGHLKSGHNPPP